MMKRGESFDDLRTKLFKFSRELRYAAVLDRNGRVVSGGMRKGVKSLEPKEEELRLMAHIVSESSTRETWDRYFGKTIYTIVRRENVILMVFQGKKQLIFITAEPTFGLEKVAAIREMLGENIQYD
ncbi:MAG: hypothetical protein M1503_05030 [Thaumarchaeota archaeon]|nr:hypothetical protein [Nitrososphaerota archaeon]MCL5317616.1 hypothetical protein [Nitrososphaerota archaeon]